MVAVSRPSSLRQEKLQPFCELKSFLSALLHSGVSHHALMESRASDTGAWFAAVVPSNPNHAAAQWFAANTTPLITSDYIVDETLPRRNIN